jgi:hypothetical protein
MEISCAHCNSWHNTKIFMDMSNFLRFDALTAVNMSIVSHGFCYCAVLQVVTNIQEDCTASVLGSGIKMEILCSSEMLVTTCKCTRVNNPEDYKKKSNLTRWYYIQYHVCVMDSCKALHKISDTAEPRFYVFLSFATFFKYLQFPYIHSALFTRFYVSEISNIPWFTSIERLQREQCRHTMASAERTSAIYIFRALKEERVLT